MTFLRRCFRHLVVPAAWHRRALPRAALGEIERAVAAAEAGHGGQLVVAIEARLGLRDLVRGTRPRERAHELFASLGAWDTAGNSGVLIYLLLAERDIEIVADRGYRGSVSDAEWRGVCEVMEAALGRGEMLDGVLAGIAAAGVLTARAALSGPGNELPDRPREL